MFSKLICIGPSQISEKNPGTRQYTPNSFLSYRFWSSKLQKKISGQVSTSEGVCTAFENWKLAQNWKWRTPYFNCEEIWFWSNDYREIIFSDLKFRILYWKVYFWFRPSSSHVNFNLIDRCLRLTRLKSFTVSWKTNRMVSLCNICCNNPS